MKNKFKDKLSLDRINKYLPNSDWIADWDNAQKLRYKLVIAFKEHKWPDKLFDQALHNPETKKLVEETREKKEKRETLSETLSEAILKFCFRLWGFDI